jgi:hypothetical protein
MQKKLDGCKKRIRFLPVRVNQAIEDTHHPNGLCTSMGDGVFAFIDMEMTSRFWQTSNNFSAFYRTFLVEM